MLTAGISRKTNSGARFQMDGGYGSPPAKELYTSNNTLSQGRNATKTRRKYCNNRVHIRQSKDVEVALNIGRMFQVNSSTHINMDTKHSKTVQKEGRMCGSATSAVGY